MDYFTADGGVYAHSSSNGRTATLVEFQRVLHAIHLDGLVPLAPRIFELFDYNHDGWIDLREVVCGFSLLRTSGKDALELCFKVHHLLPLGIKHLFQTPTWLLRQTASLLTSCIRFDSFMYISFLFFEIGRISNVDFFARCTTTMIQASFRRTNWFQFLGYVTVTPSSLHPSMNFIDVNMHHSTPGLILNKKRFTF